jgi:LuxR family maltose regulon positive regulatory protein
MTPTVQGDCLLYQQDGQEQVLTVGTAAWFAWLETASTFSFVSETGRFTVRRERSGHKRGGWYWKAYRKQRGKLSTRYLGKAETITLARLRDVARAFAEAPVGAAPGKDAGAAFPPAHAATPGMQSEALIPLLTTKLYRPLPRVQLVRRSHLMQRLTQGVAGPLTLISAPAGFGKTTLVSQWLAACRRPAAWVSLDAGENDPARFLMYLVAAVQAIAATVGRGVVAALLAPQPPPIDVMLTTLVNDISRIPDPFVLVLDDYHVIESQAVDQALIYLVEHLPPQMHLVLATREDPPLPLARFRARGQLTEVRAADLRFTSSEAAEFLNDVMGLRLSANDIARLSDRTEGWIAGLQLASLSMQGHQDASGFIQAFAGDHHYIVDYLVTEVLQRQPEHIQMFLLRTSILERLSGPLCDAVTRDPATPGQATLEYLDRANLFLVSLDHERRWYRYHHLFADLLRQRLPQRIATAKGEIDSCVNDLHLRASQWYEDHGLELEAFHHAAAAHDVERAERLMEGGKIPLHVRGAVTTLLNWLASLPTSALDARPSLWWRYAGLLLVNGQTIGVEEKLQAAEAALTRAEADDQSRNLLVGRIAAARATLALTRYQVDSMLVQSRRALEYLPPDHLSLRANAHWTLGYAYWTLGDRVAARRSHTEAIALSQAAGDSFTTILATIGLGNVQEADNELLQAAETYQRVLRLAGEMPQPIVSEAHLGMARICYEWNDLEASARHGRQSLHLARQYESFIDRFVLCEVALARLKLAQGDVDGATAMLAQVSQAARQRNFVYRLPEVAAAQVLALLRQGHLAAAAQLAATYDLPLSQARVSLAQGDPSTALATLALWREQVEAKGWVDERLQALALQALALQAQGDQDQAEQALGEALALAEPGGFVRTFVDEGPPMARLLTAAAALGRMPHYIGRLLAACEAEEQKRHGVSSRLPTQPLIEPLSRREEEVLRLIAQGLSNQEISERLVLAVSTVKGHNRSIFDKLQVQRRTEAVARARELGLL